MYLISGDEDFKETYLNSTPFVYKHVLNIRSCQRILTSTFQLFIQEETAEAHGKNLSIFLCYKLVISVALFLINSPYVGKSHRSTLYQRSGNSFHYIGYTVPEY